MFVPLRVTAPLAVARAPGANLVEKIVGDEKQEGRDAKADESSRHECASLHFRVRVLAQAIADRAKEMWSRMM
jgi:hypothetical protein